MVEAGVRVPLELRLENAVVSCVRFLGKTVLRFKVAVFYPHPAAWPMGEVVMCGLERMSKPHGKYLMTVLNE